MPLHSALNTLDTCTIDPSQLTVYDLGKEFKFNDLGMADLQPLILPLLRKIRGISQLIPCLPERYRLANGVRRANDKIEAINTLESSKSMSLFPDFKQRLSVLKLLGYVDKDAVNITLKGRVACELNTCDELLGAEILFSNLLDPLNPPEAVAMLSALVFQEKNNNEEPLTSRMEVAKATMMDILAKINKLQELEKVSNDEENKISLNFGLATVVYQWARGMSFNDICLVTEFQEGTIVRAITRLDELCKDFMKVSLIIGNPSLHAKMEAASLCIRRDIVFAASLYIVL